jgi:hypothetical protein
MKPRRARTGEVVPRQGTTSPWPCPVLQYCLCNPTDDLGAPLAHGARVNVLRTAFCGLRGKTIAKFPDSHDSYFYTINLTFKHYSQDLHRIDPRSTTECLKGLIIPKVFLNWNTPHVLTVNAEEV